MPPRNEKEPLLCFVFAEETPIPPVAPFLAETFDWIAPDMIEPNLKLQIK